MTQAVIAGGETTEAALSAGPHLRDGLLLGVAHQGEARRAGSRRDATTGTGVRPETEIETARDLQEEASIQDDDPDPRSIETVRATVAHFPVVPPLPFREPALTVVVLAPLIDVAMIDLVLHTLDAPRPLVTLPSPLLSPPATHHRDPPRVLSLLDGMTVPIPKPPFLLVPSLDPQMVVPACERKRHRRRPRIPFRLPPLDRHDLLLVVPLPCERRLQVRGMAAASTASLLPDR